MAQSFGAAFKSFWHTMTSNDRHSTFDSPHRSGRHVPLQNSRNNSVFTGVATASDSRQDITSPYSDGRGSPSHDTPTSPNGRAYSPGLRSIAARNASQTDGFDVQSPGEVPLQSFEDGLPPAPPVKHSWRRIEEWADEHYPELHDQICEGATHNDMIELEHQLDCSLPQDVRDSWMIHDGQERGGIPTGIIFSSMLLDCEEIVQEWDNWRTVNNEVLEQVHPINHTVPPKAMGGSSSEASSSTQRPHSQSSNGDEWRQNLLSKQSCVPPNSIRKAYAHSSWIPLVRDWGGNNIAVDLAPGPKGRWGQIILTGRDYDTKYVVAKSWSHFLAVVADDLSSGKWYIDDESGELKLREFKETRVEPGYLSILRWRMDQKYGRRAPQPNRKSMAPQGQRGSPLGSRSSSPYASPVEANGDSRGRSMQRLRGSSPLTSPRPGMGKPLALSRVTEEAPIPELESANIDPSTLVEVEETPIRENPPIVKAPRNSTLARSESDLIKLNPKDKENVSPPPTNGKQPAVADDSMKDIEI